MKKWPKDDKPARFEDICNDICKAINFAYTLQRRNASKNIPWKGLEIGKQSLCGSFGMKEALSAESLAYQLEDQGRDALKILVGRAVMLGIEQGRRAEVNSTVSQIKDITFRLMEARLEAVYSISGRPHGDKPERKRKAVPKQKTKRSQRKK